MLIKDIFTNSNYGNSLFHADEIAVVEKSITIRPATVKTKETAYIKCLVRKKEIKLTPEEAVRQLYLYRLMNTYGYPTERIQVEYAVHFGREIKRADIVIMDKDKPTVPYIIIEVKKPKLSDGKEQLKSYCNATGAPIAAWTNGEQYSRYHRKDPNYFEDISALPKATETLADVLNEKVTYEDLKLRDKIKNEKRSLRSIIKEAEDEVLANAGVDAFEEIFKLLFSKLYDEMTAANDASYYLKFRNSGDTETQLKVKIEELFTAARGKWEGIFTDSDRIQLTPSHLAISKQLFLDKHYHKSVLAAFVEINDRVKKIRKGIDDTELDGDGLMKDTFSPKQPKLCFEDTSTDSGKNVQLGYMEIFAGVMKGIRNPNAHENMEVSKGDAVRKLMLASLLMYKVDDAVSFSGVAE